MAEVSARPQLTRVSWPGGGPRTAPGAPAPAGAEQVRSSIHLRMSTRIRGKPGYATGGVREAAWGQSAANSVPDAPCRVHADDDPADLCERTSPTADLT